jgi:hypothetical protein
MSIQSSSQASYNKAPLQSLLQPGKDNSVINSTGSLELFRDHSIKLNLFDKNNNPSISHTNSSSDKLTNSDDANRIRPFTASVGNSSELIKTSTSHANLVSKAEKMWMMMVQELRDSALNITYKDIVEISKLKKPTEDIQNIIYYLCFLLGLKSSWDAAKTSLFKEIFALIKFIRQVIELLIFTLFPYIFLLTYLFLPYFRWSRNLSH